MEVGPAVLLSVLLGTFHTALFVFIRGSAGGRLPLLFLAAAAGAAAGDWLGDRLGIDFITIGDYRVVAASVVSWAGILLVAVLSTLGPTRRRA